MVILGVDAHKRTHTLVAIDDAGRKLGERMAAATTDGHLQALRWAARFAWLWLGHESIESTNIYLHADMALKERALASTSPPGVRVGRYRASDELLAFLDHL
jgi:hypothetical protein